MISNKNTFAFLVLAAALTGCQQDRSSKPSETTQPAAAGLTQAAATSGSFSGFASSDGTFLVDQKSGKAWKFSLKENAFLEVPVTSSILIYNPKSGNLEKQTDQSSKPCDKAKDPLCILN